MLDQLRVTAAGAAHILLSFYPHTMKYSIVFVVALLLGVATTSPLLQEPTNNPSSSQITVQFTTAVEDKGSLCPTCASLTGQSINILLNYILNAGVVGTCAKVCSNLKSKGASTVCNLVCDLVGVKAFVGALEKADLDPIYFCDLLGVCKHDDNGAGLTHSNADPRF